ncbi:basic amino acid ABC transporter substrate-binding protein [Staphylospora marina]|uniref:basic amino acid ABC transporter substrate-binding protein n=1 Tax=Staphylospora marina TaxID=2490858 RepID=UPI0013DDB323|nr:basic amino acid ABC transporter substrate-binding protein [Staphylospora marina]
MLRLKSCRWFLAIVGLVLMLTGCGGGAVSGGEKKAVTIKVGTDAQFPPFEMKDSSDQLSGFDIDLMKAIASETGQDVQIIHTGWDPMFEKLKSGEIDAAISAISITEERKKDFDFSAPYFEATQMILVPAHSPIKSFKDVKGKKVGVASGTTGEELAEERLGKNDPGIRKYKDVGEGIKDLKAGRIDAVLADRGLILYWLKQLGDEQFKVVEDPSFPSEQYGIMVKKGNTELLKMIDDGLDKVRKDGIYDQIFLEYFSAIESSVPLE